MGLKRVLLTPQLATELLGNYADNSRPLSENTVEFLTYVVRNPPPDHVFQDEVTVTADGRTVRGQHLLHAVVRAQVPVEITIDYQEK